MELDPATDVPETLLAMQASDQAMRERYLRREAPWDSSVDEQNTTTLKQIVAHDGWPTISRVGEAAANAAWLVAQHAPDIDFMEECLDHMRAAPEGEVQAANRAYLEDRVRILRHRPQLYGTQFRREGSDVIPFDIEDPDNLEARRASVGLETYAEYIKRVRAESASPPEDSVLTP
jgi:hypothetical protein